jgi:hypothetical protein
MNFLNGKILLLVILLLAILGILTYLQLSRRPDTTSPLPIPKMEQSSPTPTEPLIPFNQLTEEQKIQSQNKADEYYQKTEDDILKKYPWFLKLPLKDTNYFVYFDPTTETFTAKLYPQKASSSSIDEQVNSMKNIVTQKIATLGSGADKYKIDWVVIPE